MIEVNMLIFTLFMYYGKNNSFDFNVIHICNNIPVLVNVNYILLTKLHSDQQLHKIDSNY
jgi:hypothetical protein